jgi:transposase
MEEDGRRMSKEQQKAARQRAMKLLDSGWMQADVAQAVGMHVRTVRQWGQHRREQGIKSLLADARGREVGDGRTLQKEQEKEIQKLIRDKLPDQLKLPFALWTRKAVAQLIEARYALRLPVRTMGEYLKRWGFTPQKPIKKAYEQQPKAVKKWLKETYPSIAAQARQEDAEIYWGDQTGVNNQPNAPRGYAPQGQTPRGTDPTRDRPQGGDTRDRPQGGHKGQTATVSQRSKRFGFSVMSAVTNRGSARWMVYKGALNSALLIKFMARLLKAAGGRKVYLILDNLRVHHSAPVKAWLALHAEEIAMHHLPSYSPELNPDERLNRALKSKLSYLPAPRDSKQLQAQTLAQLHSCHKQPSIIRGYFQSATTSYAA